MSWLGLIALVGGVLAVALVGLRPALGRFTAALEGAPAGTERVAVEEVIDGDTLIVSGGRHVRVLGINAPETHNPNLAGPEPFGEDATDRMTALVAGGTVALEREVTDKDRYSRQLRDVWVGRTLVAEVLAREGLAHALTIAPNGRYADRIRAAEAEARRTHRGLWGAARPTALAVFGTPSDSVALADTTPSADPAEVTSSTAPTDTQRSADRAAVEMTQPCGARVAGAIPAESAGDFLNTFQTVEFQVVGTKDTGKVTFLNSHNPFQGFFYVAIFPDQYPEFPAPPAQYFRGKCVVVQGTIELYRGTAQLVVRTGEDIRVLGK